MGFEHFKGDAQELQFEASAAPVFDRTSTDLNAFWVDAYNSSPWLLQLYDENRMPFADRINRDAFVVFIKEALKRFPFTGSFDSYLFVIRAVFGALSSIVFSVAAPGKLEIDVNATSALEFDFIGQEFVSGAYDQFNLIADSGEQLVFRGLSGIETGHELSLLFSELMPAGITPTVALTFFTRSDFIAEDPAGTFYNVVDTLGNQIVFSEIG